MQCDVCQSKEATVFLTQIIDGKTKKVNLCESCAKEKEVNNPTGFALTDLLMGLGATQEMEKKAGILVCPVCGFTKVDLKKTGRLGCSACYNVFADALTGMLKNMHKGTSHTGKAPAVFQQIRQQGEKLRLLRENLSQAVVAEEYERAADLRDQIHKLEAPI